MKKNLIKNSIMLFSIVFFLSCDHGAILISRNGKEKIVKSLNSCVMEFSMVSSGGVFELYTEILNDDEIVIFTDSLKLCYNSKEINEVEIRDKNGTLKNKVINFPVGKKYLFYSFLRSRTNVKKGDEVSIFANNYIKHGDKFFDLDTITFVVPKKY